MYKYLNISFHLNKTSLNSCHRLKGPVGKLTVVVWHFSCKLIFITIDPNMESISDILNCLHSKLREYSHKCFQNVFDEIRSINSLSLSHLMNKLIWIPLIAFHVSTCKVNQMPVKACFHRLMSYNLLLWSSSSNFLFWIYQRSHVSCEYLKSE